MMSTAKRRRAAIAVFLLAVTVTSAIAFLEYPSLTVARTPDPCSEWTNADSHGQEIVAIEVDGKPPDVKAPAADVPLSDIAAGVNSLSNVPAFDWSYGCSATSAAMLFGYYDRTGYSNMYAGPTNSGVCPLDNSIWGDTVYPSITCHECPLSATHQGVDGRVSKGHVDDYWVDADDPGPDPYVGNWPEHAQADCSGDYMGTNESKFGNVDGETTFWFNADGDPLYDSTSHEPSEIDGCHGMKDFAISRGYSVLTNFNQYIKGQGSDPNKGFTFSQYVAEIDAGRPVLIQVEGHTMLGYGYNTTGNVVYLHDTWDHSSHTMTWGSTYSGMQHYGVTVVRLSHVATATINASGLVASYPATVHYVQGGVSKTATTYGTWSQSVDYGSTVSIDNTVGVSSTEWYSTNAVTSWTATQTATYTVPYYHQFKLGISVATNGAGHTDLGITNSATFTYRRFGSDGTLNVFDGQNFFDWVDAGSAASLSNLSSASNSARRWCSSGATSWVINDATSKSATYWEQFRVTVVPTGLDTSHPANVKVVQNGLSASFAASTSWSDWADVGSTLSIAKLVVVSETERCSTTDATSWTIAQTATYPVNYARQYYLTVQSERGNPQGTGWYDRGSAALVYVDPTIDEGAGIRYVFDSWSGGSGGVNNPSSVVMGSPKTITAIWRTQYRMTVNSTPLDVAVISGGGWYDEGASAFTGIAGTVMEGGAGTRYIFLSWSLDGNRVLGNPIAVNMDSTHAVTALYITQYELRVWSDRGNTQGSGWYDAGSEVNFSVDSSSGIVVQQIFAGWSGGSSATLKDAAVLMDGPKTIEAHWKPDYTQLIILVTSIVVVAELLAAFFFLRRKRRKRQA